MPLQDYLTQHPFGVSGENLTDSSGITPFLGTATVRGLSTGIHLSIRTDGRTGAGTPEDPLDASSTHFDEIMDSFQTDTNLKFVLHEGTYEVASTHTWAVKTGWSFEGVNREQVVIKLVGVRTQTSDIGIFKSSTSGADNVYIANLTCDCNYDNLTGTVGAGFKSAAIALWGKNNIIDNVHTKNTYGKFSTGAEQFAIGLNSATGYSARNCIIRNCFCELPKGDYGAPFALFGNATYPMTESGVENCQANGVPISAGLGPTSLGPVFNTGGVNLAYIKDCWIEGNSFADCAFLCYIDTGTLDGLSIVGNRCVRACGGVGLQAAGSQTNVEIIGNRIHYSNRVNGGASYGVLQGTTTITNLVILGNRIQSTSGGGGLASYRDIYLQDVNGCVVSNNVTNDNECLVAGSNYTILGNRNITGSMLVNLPDHDLPSGVTSRVSTQFDKTNTTLANVSGLTVNLEAGRKYAFKAQLFLTLNTTGAGKVAISGTATATTFSSYVKSENEADHANSNFGRVDALGESVSLTNNQNLEATIEGSIVVNAKGTLTVQFAQNSANGTSSVLVGSTFTVKEIT